MESLVDGGHRVKKDVRLQDVPDTLRMVRKLTFLYIAKTTLYSKPTKRRLVIAYSVIDDADACLTTRMQCLHSQRIR